MDSVTRMAIDGQQAFAIIATVLWTMLRIGAMVTAMPMLGSSSLPGRLKVMASLALAIALAPMLPAVPVWDGFNAATVLSIFREVAIGVAIGLCLRLIFEAGALAGELIALGTGLSFAQMTDPLRGGTSGVVGQWFYLLFGLLFFTSNGHLALIALLVDSYRTLPIGSVLPDVDAFLAILPTLMLAMFRGGLGLALPLVVAMLAINLVFGALARAAPALNPIQLGLPAALLLGLLLLTVLSSQMGPPVQQLFDQAFDAARSLSQ